MINLPAQGVDAATADALDHHLIGHLRQVKKGLGWICRKKRLGFLRFLLVYDKYQGFVIFFWVLDVLVNLDTCLSSFCLLVSFCSESM